MAYCLNPDCTHPQNRDRQTHCAACGQNLNLKDRYRVLKAIDQGGFGRTFLGMDLHFPQTPKCVIKQLYFQTDNTATQDKVTSLFQQEALRLSQLGNHPQIPALLAYFEHQGQLYLVQEFIDGRSLNPAQWSCAQRSGAHIERLLKSLLPVLHFIHERNIIHRDIKPENIMLRRRDRQFVLIDFGVARVFTETALIGGATIIGTPGFMAPEQMRGKVLPASDLYSLGATCINLLTGVDPDDLFDVVNERWQWREQLPAHTQLSPAVVKVLNQLLAPSLRQRSQSAIAVLRSLGVHRPPTRSSPPQAIPSTPSEPEHEAEAIVSTQPTVPTAPTIPTVRIDYTELKTALTRKRWRIADDLTREILCQLVHKPKSGYLFPNDLPRLPCADLKGLELLWRKYSDARFGLGVQLEIYTAVAGDYVQFCDRIGWPIANPPNHNYLQYNLKAPLGHLPSRKWMGGTQGWKQVAGFYGRLRDCLER
ncbi:MAG: protein kinase [Spirulina sp. SIO3F2]|nr:protein kinase [Spirulina sp. SIO3F2]